MAGDISNAFILKCIIVALLYLCVKKKFGYGAFGIKHDANVKLQL